MQWSWPWRRRFLTTPPRSKSPIHPVFPQLEDNPAFKAETIQFLIDSVPGLSLSNLKIVADCANGAAAAIAPELFRRLNPDGNAEVILLNIAPDGRNINAGCGALHPELRRPGSAKARARILA